MCLFFQAVLHFPDLLATGHGKINKYINLK